MNKRIKYNVSMVTGEKYPHYNPTFSIHPNGTQLYCAFGDGDRGNIRDLPKDEYPYLMEYEN